MRVKLSNAKLALAAGLSFVLLGACGEVRPGGYEGSFPGPVMVAVPQTASFQAAVAQASAVRRMLPTANPDLSLSVRSWNLTSGRSWSYVGHVGFGGWWSSSSGAVPQTVEASVWPALASALDISPIGDDDVTDVPVLAAGMLELTASGVVATDVDHLLLAASKDMTVQPIGPAGPTLVVSRGYHLFERSCTPDGYAAFNEVPLDVLSRPIETGTVSPTGWVAPMDPFVAACGVDATAPIDLGNVAAPIAMNQSTPSDPFTVVEALAWTPSADAVFALVGPGREATNLAEPSARLQRLAIGDPVTTPVTSDDLAPPLTVATGGGSVLVWRKSANRWDYVRQALTPAVTPLQVSLSDPAAAGPAGDAYTALSADGNLVASASITGYRSTGMTFVDLRTGLSVFLALPAAYAPAPLTGIGPPAGFAVVPRAWDPTGVALLVEVWSSSDPGAHSFAVLTLDVAGALPSALGAPVPLPAALPTALATGRATAAAQPVDTAARYFWSVSGPRVLLQDADGARVYDFVTQQLFPLVEPTSVARADTGVDVVVGTERAFAWAVQCFGVAETSCRAQLRRLAMTTGVIDVVATAETPRPFAVSPDGKTIVLADDASIYLKTVAP